MEGIGEGYALDRYTFAYAPSAQALYHAREAAGRPADSLLAVENPDGTLAFPEYEVRSVRKHFEESQTIFLPREKATKAAVLNAMQRAAVLHFSTHGSAGWDEANRAALTLADGRLFLSELSSLHLQAARYAILSACETGVPALKNLDEVESLPSGLMQSGVPGVVGSLWSVDDLSTAMLIARFYDLWKTESLPPAQALRQAQIWLRDSNTAEKKRLFKHFISQTATRMSEHSAKAFYERIAWDDPDASVFQHPFYWAAFSFTGI